MGKYGNFFGSVKVFTIDNFIIKMFGEAVVVGKDRDERVVKYVV